MHQEAWLPQIVLLVALIAAFVRAIRGQVFVPIADGPSQRGPVLLPPDNDEDEEEAAAAAAPAPRRRRFSLAMLPAAVLFTAAIRVALLVALHR